MIKYKDFLIIEDIDNKVYFGKNYSFKFLDYISSKYSKVLIISDNNIWNLYNEKFENLDNKDKIYKFLIEPTESSKSFYNYLKIVDFLIENNFSRNDLIVAFGGGVVGDLAGFVSATFHRGLTFLQIPTTLLAMVDSSIGGKNGINYGNAKNIIGTFKNPDFIVCDTNILDTLGSNFIRQGFAEIIKYAILFDEELFDYLERTDLDKLDFELIIKKCIEHKVNIVNEDKFDKGKRNLLNLGHTVGHSIEKLSDFEISHGDAVAIGIIYISYISTKLGLCKNNVFNRIVNLIEKFDLPISVNFSYKDIFNSSTYDKKINGDMINIILVNDIGDCMINKISLDLWKQYLELVDDKNI